MPGNRAEDQRPENASNILYVNPISLMQDNPAALIVNRESYQRIGAHFAPDQFDPPQVVRVKTFSPEHGQLIKLFVLDGMTRTKYAADQQGKEVPGHPDFSFDAIPVRDVTASVVMNPIIVSPEDRLAAQDGISMLQYLRAVIPPTVEHSEIAADRIAAHLLNGWENMVGTDLSQRFSALAALGLLESQRVPIATDDQLKRFLATQEKIMAGETSADRARLQQGLLETASIIRQTKLLKQEVARSAYILVSAGAPVIGGQRESYRQIHGLLHTPVVERKLADATESLVEREQLRELLGRTIGEAFIKATGSLSTQHTINALTDALRDPSLTLRQVTEVFTAPSPIDSYDQIRRAVNIERLTNTYTLAQQERAPSQLERGLINRLANRAFLPDTDVTLLSRVIHQAVEIDTTVRRMEVRLQEERNDLLKKGVTVQLLDEAQLAFNDFHANLLVVNSPQAISQRIREATDMLSAFDQKITRQIQVRLVSDLVKEAYASDLQQAGFNLQVQSAIAQYVLREVNPSDERAVRTLLSQLRSFDLPTQSRVVRGDVRLGTLIRDREYGERRSAQQDQPQSVLLDNIDIEDRRAVEGRRIEVSNRRLLEATLAFLEELRQIDLDRGELTSETKHAIDGLVRILGRNIYDHPDLVRVIEQDYPQLLQQVITLQEVKLRQEREETDRGTRTSR